MKVRILEINKYIKNVITVFFLKLNFNKIFKFFFKKP